MALTEEGLMHVPGVLSRYVRLANGARAHYVTAGETGPAVILMHGGIVGSSGMAGWRSMVPFLGQNGFRVFAPDRPGFGFADTRKEYWPVHGWKSYADFLRDFADALCLDEFYLGGNSNGAQNAMYFMVNDPHRVKAAALIATGSMGQIAGAAIERPAGPPPGAGAGGGGGPRMNAFDGTPEGMRAAMDYIIFNKATMTDDLLQMRTIAGNLQKESFAAARVFGPQPPNMEQWLEIGDRLRKLTFPIIYVQGLQDLPRTVEGSRLAEPLLPDIQFFYPDQTGHQAQTDSPDMLNQVFLEFFRDGKVSRKTADWAGVSKNRPEIPELVEQAAGTPA